MPFELSAKNDKAAKRIPGRNRIRLGVLGATGRMGALLSQFAERDSETKKIFELVLAVAGDTATDFKALALAAPDLLIDFSAPEASLQAAKVCGKEKIAMLVCTTGFSKEQSAALAGALKNTTWALVPNTSLGIFTLCEALKAALKVLPKEFDLSVVEVHHSAKKDAPSGTAKLLERVIQAASPQKALPVLAIRGGGEVGEHRVLMLGPSERLEFVHHAQSRDLFARGALKLGAKLAALKPRAKAYTVEEIFA